MPATPRVSCIIPAFNAGRYIERAVDSVLGQTYPAELVEVVVVDDGSTDDTAARVAAYGDRVTLVRQANGGVNSAIDAGLARARGELIATLDADDELHPGNLERHVGVLDDRPEVGLVYCDMEIVDQHGARLHPSFFSLRGLQPREGAVLGDLLAGNFVPSSVMLRASLRDRVSPIPAVACYQDWWIGIAVARVAELAFVPEPLYRYRTHDANRNLGGDAETHLANLESELPFRRLLLRDPSTDDVPVTLLAAAYAAFEGMARIVASGRGLPVEGVLAIDAADRAAAETLAARAGSALAAALPGLAMRRAVAALAADPWHAGARALARTCQTLLADPTTPPDGEPSLDALLGDVRGRLVLTTPEVLLRRPELLEAWGAAFEGGDDVVLGLVMPPVGGEALLADVGELVTALGLDGADAAELVAFDRPAEPVVERALLRRAAGVLAGPGDDPAFAPDVRRYDTADLADVRTALGAAARPAEAA